MLLSACKQELIIHTSLPFRLGFLEAAFIITLNSMRLYRHSERTPFAHPLLMAPKELLCGRGITR